MSLVERDLADAVVAVGMMSRDEVDEVRRSARAEGEDFLGLLVGRGRFPRSALWRALAQQRGLPYLTAGDLTVEGEPCGSWDASALTRRLFLPLRRVEGERVLVAVDRPVDGGGLRAIERAIGAPASCALAETRDLQRAICAQVPEARSLLSAPDEFADPTRALDEILRESLLSRASDVHLDPERSGYRIRLRVDGTLRDLAGFLSRETGQGLISRVKVLSNLDISEMRSPQDGSWKFGTSGDGLRVQAQGAEEADRQVDVRVATIPTTRGEKMTLRLLPGADDEVSLQEIGMSESDLDRFRGLIKNPHGLLIITGPTGSGKSTTLNAAIGEINDPAISIMTAEDPVEREIDGVTQVGIDGVGKVAFHNILRALLRHDPDVMMIGEIRDSESAGIAFQAAATGHLVFSTLHTNDTPSALSRLADLGVEGFQVGGSLLGVIGQRLVRRLCTACREEVRPSAAEAAQLGLAEESTVFAARGCPHCLGTGYRGRVGIFETLEITPDLRRMMTVGLEGADAVATLEAARVPLWVDGAAKVREGVTSLAELLRVATPPAGRLS